MYLRHCTHHLLKIVEMWEKVDVSKIFCIEERFFFFRMKVMYTVSCVIIERKVLIH